MSENFGKRMYEKLMEAGANSLADNEFWCVFHPNGPLEMTASKRMDEPVITVCDALGAEEWDDLKEQGYYLGKIILDPSTDKTSDE